ncbi:flavin containing amine oxidoreductase [Grosmannia clavigera kw1407]|uniref:Flavin containing amine oxidoreductase n=1 Tax=Grosmannia clavigera (strain kw1407 / UAMH 11150) TaxID=655863 RepID=F0XGA5_GROCL|nr:flavin containing amine oxidoreductase [Grosmannia clavigera kw1407]EFX03271.1 flavin containing amine oxidoreductase [Grosmannia clavigera kw1407]
MAQAVRQDATIHFGQTVIKVVSRMEDWPIGCVNVTTASGDAFLFDELVFTAPLGWLKQHQASTFQPPLPARLVSAIDSIGYGCLEKVYISFPDAFWKRPDATTGRVVRGFCQWLAPGVYAQPSNPEHWPHEAVDLSTMPASTAHPTLLFYTFGAQSRHITDTLEALRANADKTDTTDTAQNNFLINYFRPYFSRLPHYDAVEPACQPVACLATSWLHDDLAGNGSYSNFQVGLEAGDEDVRTMREGLPDRGLWLAGEHTAPFVALGTATGAHWSGESVGRRIAESYGRQRE